LLDIEMISENEGWAVGTQGTIMHYWNGNWYLAAKSTNFVKPVIYTAIDWVSPSEVWIVGSFGSILHSETP
jgi:hypothetical protein